MPGWVGFAAILRAGRSGIEEPAPRLARARPSRRAAGARYASRPSGLTVQPRPGSGAGWATKQAAGQMVDELVRLGYVQRGQDPVVRAAADRHVDAARGRPPVRASAEIFDGSWPRGERRARVDDAVGALEQLAALDGGAELRPIW